MKKSKQTAGMSLDDSNNTYIQGSNRCDYKNCKCYSHLQESSCVHTSVFNRQSDINHSTGKKIHSSCLVPYFLFSS